MKKLVLLSLTVIMFVSCKSDDDVVAIPAQANLTSIVGTWKLDQAFEDGVEESLTFCDKEATSVFTEQGDFSFSQYTDGATSEDCVLDSQGSGTWTNIDNVYTFTVDSFSNEITIVFGVDTFSYEQTETINGDTETYKEVFKKQ